MAHRLSTTNITLSNNDLTATLKFRFLTITIDVDPQAQTEMVTVVQPFGGPFKWDADQVTINTGLGHIALPRDPSQGGVWQYTRQARESGAGFAEAIDRWVENGTPVTVYI